MVPAGCFMVSIHWSAMQPGSPLGRGFEKGFLIRKSNEKGAWEGVHDQKGVLEMRFLAGFLIRKGFSVWIPDGVPDHIPEPRAPPVTPVCPCRALLTSSGHWWWISKLFWAMGMQQRMHQKGSKCPKCRSQGLDQAPMCVGRYHQRHQ